MNCSVGTSKGKFKNEISRRRLITRAQVGFISIPRYFDYSPQEFLKVAPNGTGAIQRILHVPDYTYTLKQRSDNFYLIDEAATCLSDAHCQVIGQTGVNWSHCTGTSPDEIRDYCEGVSNRCGAKLLMMGLSIVDAINAIGAKQIAVCNGYYTSDWAEGTNRFLTQAGFDITWSGTMVDLGLYESEEELLRIAEANQWMFTPDETVQAIWRTHQNAPDVDAVVQTGFGLRTLSHVSAIEAMIEKPLISSDLSLYWAMLRELSTVAPCGNGSLLAAL